VNFLAICQSVHQKFRGGNAIPGSQPTTIPVSTSPRLDQSVYDIVDAVQRAWEDIQNHHPSWQWMRAQGDLSLLLQRVWTVTQIQLQIPTYRSLISFDAGSATQPYGNLYDSGAATPTYLPIWWIAYENWRGYWDRQPFLTPAQPARFTQRPDYSLEFSPAPGVPPSGAGNAWHMVFDYKTLNTTLAVSGDTPNMPPQFHELIVWKAIEILSAERGSTGLLAQQAQNFIYGSNPKGSGKLDQLIQDQTPLVLIDTGW
jgi:hypothetical protein